MGGWTLFCLLETPSLVLFWWGGEGRNSDLIEKEASKLTAGGARTKKGSVFKQRGGLEVEQKQGALVGPLVIYRWVVMQ